jgi:Na+/melibiose symporter-like transporter
MPANTRTHVPFLTKMEYACGSLGEGFVNYAISAFVVVYYTQALGLSGTLAGAAFFITLVFDAISDPWIGAWSDRFKSVLGRRHPFIFLSAIPVGATFYCIYMPPEFIRHASEEAGLFGYSVRECLLFSWLFVFASLFKIFLTLYHVPHLALGSELSGDYVERTRVLRWNQLAVYWGSAMLAFSFYGFYFPDNAIAKEHDATFFAASVSLTAVVLILLSAFLTRDQVKYLPQPNENLPRFTFDQFLKEFWQALNNRNYLFLLGGYFFLAPLTGVREVMHYQMNIHYWELPTSLIKWIALSNLPVFLLIALAIPFFHTRFDKSRTMLIGIATLAFASVTPVLSRSFFIFPENGSDFLFPTLLVFNWLFYSGSLMISISVYSALGDVTDEHELKTGRRMEGIFYSARTFFGKVTIGMGALIGGIAIDVIGFPSKAIVGEVDADVLFQLGIVEGPLASIPLLGAIVCYGMYNLDRKKQIEIQSRLAEKEVPELMQEVSSR